MKQQPAMGQKDKKREAEEQQKRPGSAVSREFQPNRQQKAGSVWRKQDEQAQKQPQQQQIYGFVPFKSGGINQQPSIYGTNNIRPSQHPPQQLHHPNDYMHSIYAPPQIVRQNRLQPQQQDGPLVVGGLRGAQIQHKPPENIVVGAAGPVSHQPQPSHQQMGGAIGSRPGSDLGMYKMISSRCQSYTTLPRPEHGPPELLEEMATIPFNKSQPLQIYGTRDGAVAIAQIPFRPSSAASRSLGRKNSTAPLPPAYFGGPNMMFGASHMMETEFGADPGREDAGYKELVPWSTISLSSWLTMGDFDDIVFGSAIFCLGAVRLYWRADFAKGQELFYGISAICNGLVGFFASQNRSFCMFVAAFLLCCINVVFIFVPFLSGILPLVPLISSTSKPYISLGGTKEPVEVDIGLAVLSLMQLAACFSMLLFGCRAFGTTMKQVQQLKLAIIAAGQHQRGAGEGGSGSGKI